MGLFSDVDWLIILGVAAFVLLGQDGGKTVRQIGRWYGRAVRLKQDLLSEVARAADLPLPAGATAGSLRAAILSLEPTDGARIGIPVAVRTPPTAPPAPVPPPSLPWTGGYPVASWSTTFGSESTDGGRRS